MENVPFYNVIDLDCSEKVTDYDWKPEHNQCQRTLDIKPVLFQVSLFLEE